MRNIVVIDAPSNLGLRPPAPGVALMPDELAVLPRALVRSERCVGLNVTLYDPDLDPDGTAGALLADLVVGAFMDEGPPAAG
ncbi:hypothetical protein Y717_12230 [Streptomyces scopuliridis RB72]|uniref:Arginase n=1 Tax=Streptomyces scopuliridis RB72 TaxID=1440053 RepID=A0A2T7SNM5_9ACTN|nr:hypothetical protein Y717_12230 [Streptomyces scopuliridis RB72]